MKRLFITAALAALSFSALAQTTPPLRGSVSATELTPYIEELWHGTGNGAGFAREMFDALVSLFAVMRWHARVTGTAMPGVFWNLFDLRFPDGRMQKIYANLVWS